MKLEYLLGMLYGPENVETMWKVVEENYLISTAEFLPIQDAMFRFVDEYYLEKGNYPVDGYHPKDWTPDAEGSLHDAFNSEVAYFKKTEDDLTVAIVFANGY